jgi:hypothetical protein
MADKSEDADIARRRDETIKRMIATPPRSQKAEPKRRKPPSPEVRQLPKHRTNKKRDKA